MCKKSRHAGRQASSPVMADRLPACRLQARQAGGPPALTAGTAVFRRKRTSFTVSERSDSKRARTAGWTCILADSCSGGSNRTARAVKRIKTAERKAEPGDPDRPARGESPPPLRPRARASRRSGARPRAPATANSCGCCADTAMRPAPRRPCRPASRRFPRRRRTRVFSSRLP